MVSSVHNEQTWATIVDLGSKMDTQATSQHILYMHLYIYKNMYKHIQSYTYAYQGTITESLDYHYHHYHYVGLSLSFTISAYMILDGYLQ